MSEFNKIAEGYFTVSTGGTAQFINLPYLPNTFEIWNKTKWGEAPAGAATPQYAIGFAEDTAGTYYGESAVASSSAAAIQNITGTSGGFSFINAGTYTFGPTLTITGINKTTGIVTTSSAHNLSVGDAVWIYGTTGMLQIAGGAYDVTAVGSSTTFTIGTVPTSGFAANATAGFAKKLLYPDLYIPFNVVITGISQATSAVVTTATIHNIVVGQEVIFTIPGPTASNPATWGMVELDQQKGYVTAVTATTFTVNINTTSYTAFAYPTSAQAALGITPAQATPIGDQNTGYSAPGGIPPNPITIPGAFVANTRQGVLIGGTLIPNTSDVIRWRAVYPELIKTTAP